MNRAMAFAGAAVLVIGATRVVQTHGSGARVDSPAESAARASTPRWTGTFVKPPDAELKKRLTPLQYSVTQQDDTERAFSNEYWDEHRAGIFVDIVSGEPLFSSNEKYDSGTGWPSFWKPLEDENVKPALAAVAQVSWTEVRSAHANSHLGHVFHDGPKPTGLRYCIDSAAVTFIPATDLERAGYGRYAALFSKASAAAPAASPRR